MKQKTNLQSNLTRLRGLMLTVIILCSLGISQVWAGDVRDVENIVSGNQYRIKTAMGTTYYLVISNASGGNGGVTTTEANGTIFTFTYENEKWYITFTKNDNTQYLYTTGTSNGKVYYTTEKTAVGWIKNHIVGDGHYLKIGHTTGTPATDWFLQSNNSDRLGTYSSSQKEVILVDATPCTDPTTPLAVTSSASVTMGSTLTLTANAGNGGSKSWSVLAGTGTATVVGTTLTPVTPGTVTVKVHQDFNNPYCSQDAEQIVTINKRTATIVLSEAGAENTVAGAHYELDSYSLPTTAASCGTKVLVGWSTVTVDETNTKPASNYYAKGTSVTLEPGENKFYAVYATATPGVGDWEKYTESTIADGDYLIYAYDYVMNNTINSTRLSSTSVSHSADETVITSSPGSECIWHIAKSGNYYTISQEGNYVIGTGSDSQANLSSSPANNNEKFSVTHYDTDPNSSGKTHTYAFVNAYNTANSANANFKRGTANPSGYFACYASGGTANVYLFKRGAGYSAYSTDCCEPPVSALNITSANTVAMGNTITLSSTGGNGGTVNWSVTAGSGAGSITTGVFTPSSAGTVTIKAHQDKNGNVCAQDVEQDVTITINVSGVEVDPTSKSIIVGETFTVTPTISPSDATDKTVSWSSSAEGKATVSSAGLVTGVAAGSATITCTTTNGSHTDDCAVTVYGVTLAVTDDESNDLTGTIGLPTRDGIEITPAANANNYVFDHWTISNASLGSSATTKENTITNPTGAVTVTAVYLPGLEIKWYVNGEEWTEGDPSTSVESGTQYKDLTYPTDPTPGDACGNRFMGWTDHSMGAATGQSAPTPLLRSGNSDTTPITTAKEFHAVFADYAN